MSSRERMWKSVIPIELQLQLEAPAASAEYANGFITCREMDIEKLANFSNVVDHLRRLHATSEREADGIRVRPIVLRLLRIRLNFPEYSCGCCSMRCLERTPHETVQMLFGRRSDNGKPVGNRNWSRRCVRQCATTEVRYIRCATGEGGSLTGTGATPRATPLSAGRADVPYSGLAPESVQFLLFESVGSGNSASEHVM